jgi:peptidyl-prolyl cis-trans isomerase SurA
MFRSLSSITSQYVIIIRKYILFFLFPVFLHASEKLDEIVAIIGDSLILSSELDAYTLLRVNQLGIKPDSLERDILRYNLLNEIVEGKILLVHAEKDTNISITNEEIENEVNNRINYILKQNNIDLNALDALLKREQGINLITFKKEIGQQIRQEIFKQKVQQFYISADNISRNDVEVFYKEYKDSLPSLGESVRLSTISINLRPSDEVKEKAFAKISLIKEMLDNGDDFDKIAKLHSEGPNAKNGGELGYISKGTLNLINFEEIIFSLKPGETSNIFSTNMGFHIVNIIDRKDQQVRVRQIFVNFNFPEEKIQEITSLLDSIKLHCTNQEDFIKAVQLYSSDDATKARNGQLKWQVTSGLDPKIKSAFDTFTVGSISSYIKNDNLLTIYRIDDIQKNRHLTLKDDWNEIAQIAQRIYTQKKLIDLVEKWRKEIYIDIRL